MWWVWGGEWEVTSFLFSLNKKNHDLLCILTSLHFLPLMSPFEYLNLYSYNPFIILNGYI